MSIEVLVVNSEVVEIIEEGPQGPPGASARESHEVISESLVDQIIPKHDGTEATEITIDFGSASNSSVTVVNGIITALTTIYEIRVIVGVNTETIGGGGQVAVMSLWEETSSDSGVTWVPVDTSYRSVSLANGSNGAHHFALDTIGSYPAGTMIRAKATNSGTGNATLHFMAESLLTSHGLLVGRATKLSVVYKTEP